MNELYVQLNWCNFSENNSENLAGWNEKKKPPISTLPKWKGLSIDKIAKVDQIVG